MRTLVAVPSFREFRALYPSVNFPPASSGARAIDPHLSVGVFGVGGAAFGAHLAKSFFSERFDCVCIAGICGAYPDSGLGLCDVVRVDSECQGDFGYEAEDGTFNPFPAVEILKSTGTVPPPLSELRGVASVSVNTCTGTLETARLRAHTFHSQVESMEGFSGFSVCAASGVPVYEIRAVSNIASVRDKILWKTEEALAALKQALSGAGLL